MDDLARDVRLAVRQLWKSRSFTAVVAVTLALAIGVNILIFSFVSFFVLRPLPFGDTSRTTMIFATHPERGRDRMGVAYGDLVDWRRDSRSFEDLGAFRRGTYNLTGAGDPLRVQGSAATASLFRIWQLDPLQGRVLQADDDRPGAPRVAVVSHGFWSRQMGADRGIVGRTLVLDGIPHVVVGVLTPRIEIGNLSEIEVWTALGTSADPSDRTDRSLRVTGRLKPGVEVAQAQAELEALAQVQEREHPATNARWSARVLPIRSAMTGANTWTVLALMAIAVALVLAVACANVANLVLARAAARRRETAIRTALGASRSQLVRQSLTEGVVLAVLGGVLGVVLADAGLQVIRSVTFEQFFEMVAVDRRVLAFSAVVSLLTPALFGLLPALYATRHDVVGALKDAGGGAVGASVRRARGRSLLVAGQLAIALSLLLVAGLSVRMALHFQRLDLGFESRDLLTFKTELPAARYAADQAVRAFVAQVEQSLAAAPGVDAVAVAAARPALDPLPTDPVAVEGAEPPSREAQPWAARSIVGGAYFETLRVPILRGRAFGPQDAAGAEPVVIVNQTFVRRYFAGAAPLGRRVQVGAAGSPWRTVVGVARDVLNTEPGAAPLPQAYLPLEQQPVRGLTFLVRTSNVDPVVAAARSEVSRLDPQQPLYDVKTMQRAFFEELASNRVITGLFVAFAVVAIGLAAVGLYGLISYSVAQRTREIGLRVALGARRGDILRMVVGQGLRLVALGLAAGLFLGLALSRIIAGALVGVSATDPLTFTLLPLLLGVIALLASAVPACRAARLDPAVVLRAE